MAFIHQGRKRCPQALRDLPEIKDRDVPLAAFDGTDVCAVEVSFFGKLELGQAQLLSPFADAKADLGQELSIAAVHGP
jgi:hypothetical protein